MHETMPKAIRQARGSYEPAMKEGRYIGHHGRTGSILVMTPDGILRGSGARRMPEENRWPKEGWDSLKGYPWDVAPKGRAKIQKDLVSGADASRLQLPSMPVLAAAPQERRMYITRADVERFGPTDLCPGCTSVALGGRADVAHNDQCRLRIAELLSQTDAGRERLERHRRKRRQQDGDAQESEDKRKKEDKDEAQVSPEAPRG